MMLLKYHVGTDFYKKIIGGSAMTLLSKELLMDEA